MKKWWEKGESRVTGPQVENRTLGSTRESNIQIGCQRLPVTRARMKRGKKKKERRSFLGVRGLKPRSKRVKRTKIKRW